MCKPCVEAVRHFWPEMPDEEIGDWLVGSTSYPFSDPNRIWKECAKIKRKVGADYGDAYELAERAMFAAMENLGSARYWANRDRHKARRERDR